MSADIKNFRLPRYSQIPDLGLYLDQTVKFINNALSPLGCIEVTPSMVSNYVKKKYIPKPDHKLYSRDQIITLIFIVIAKLVLPMDSIALFIKAENLEPIGPEVYDDFCERFEDMLGLVFFNDPLSWEIDTGGDESNGIAMSLLIAICHYINISDYLDRVRNTAQ